MYIVRIFICIKLSSINAQASANSSRESLSWRGEPVVNGFNQLTVGNVDTLSVTLTVPVGQMISVPSTSTSPGSNFLLQILVVTKAVSYAHL